MILYKLIYSNSLIRCFLTLISDFSIIPLFVNNILTFLQKITLVIEFELYVKLRTNINSL